MTEEERVYKERNERDNQAIQKMKSHEDSNVLYRERTTRFLILRLHTLVRSDGLYVKLTPFHRSFRHIHKSEITDCSEATYSPSPYGGWHWGVNRTLQGNTVYRVRGKRGVEFELRDGTKTFVGSQSPAELQSAVAQAIETA